MVLDCTEKQAQQAVEDRAVSSASRWFLFRLLLVVLFSIAIESKLGQDPRMNGETRSWDYGEPGWDDVSVPGLSLSTGLVDGYIFVLGQGRAKHSHITVHLAQY